MENNVTETLKGEAYSGLRSVNAVTSLVREEQSSETHPMYMGVQHRRSHKPSTATSHQMSLERSWPCQRL